LFNISRAGVCRPKGHGVTLSAETAIGVVILDDHPVVRSGYEHQLAGCPDIRLLGSFSSGKALLDWLRKQAAENFPSRTVLVLDYELGPDEVDGLSLIQSLHARYPQFRLLIGSSHAGEATVQLTRRVGALGFYDKRKDLSELANAIRTVAAGKPYPSPEAGERPAVVQPVVEPIGDTDEGERLQAYFPQLTKKEHEVLRCYLQGMTVSEIAAKLQRSIKTVSTQKQSAFRKLGVHSDMELARLRQEIGKI